MNNSEPETKIWHDMKLVRISDVGKDFSRWLYGQTFPYVEDDPKPTDWAYYWDYTKYLNGGKITD